jgi:D-galactarolactone isomerase
LEREVKDAVSVSVPFSAGTRYPRITVPADACDCHIHIFDSKFPFAPNAPVVPYASIADYRLFQERIGTSRAVVVAPSMYGLDNRCTLAATAALGADARCIVTLGQDTPIQEIRAMHEQGARGFRFNLKRSSVNSLDSLLPIAERVAPLGWHVQMWMHPDGLPDAADLLLRLPIPIVFDHIAGFPLYGGLGHPAYPVLLRLLKSGKIWMKLSLATACRQLGTPAHSALNDLGREIIALAPDRLLWGSDWPHVIAAVEGVPYPDDADLIDTLLDWTSDAQIHQRILVENPAEFYGFKK